MASTDQNLYPDHLVTLICSELNGSDSDETPDDFDEIIISTADISSWNLASISAHKILKIKANPTRLIEESSYFHGILRGSFSESKLSSIIIHWNLESFVSVLRVIYGCHVEVSSDNFIFLNEAALYFGVDILLFKCRVWLEEMTSFRGIGDSQLCLDSLIEIWNYGVAHGNDFIAHLCTSYLARNFMWALTFNSYTDVPDKLLCSCIQHPDLTVDSEKHLCDAIRVWLAANIARLEPDGWSSSDLCDEIRMCLLPLQFAAGKRSCCIFSKFADKAAFAILSLARHPCTSLTDIIEEGNTSHLRFRLTKYTQKVDVSGCPQLTTGLFLISVLPSRDTNLILRKIIKKSSINNANSIGDGLQIEQTLSLMLTFEAVHELDISNCPSFSLELAIICFSKSFPSLRSLRAVNFLNFKTIKLCQLVQKLPLLSSIDLALDINPVITTQVSITASSSVQAPERSMELFDIYRSSSAALFSYKFRPLISNIIKLNLEGRTDISDSDFLLISEVCFSLSYVNIKGCTSVTDHGISLMILKCKKLQSVLACDTSFGNNSVLALSSTDSGGTHPSEKHSQLMGYILLTLHVGGCHGITGKILSELMSKADHLRSLCLRELQVVDDALYRFSGASLEMLDVSDTEVSSAALSRVVHRNPGLKSLKTRGCRHLLRQESGNKETKLCSLSQTPEELYSVLGNLCKLEEIELGWGFSFLSLQVLKPVVRTLRTLVVGLGGSLGPDGLNLLHTICPMLETLILYFQVISDSAITNIIKNLPYLQVLTLSYCSGDLSSLSFKFGTPSLRNLKLERVTPWMTNEDLSTLAENCVNLVKLSLTGCTLLDSEAQTIISSGWPGLTSLHLEECGEITVCGVRSLLDCHALEDLSLRHTGRGIPRNFITYAASELPMLRKISLDVCDASEGDFDVPNFADRYFLSIVKVTRCKLKKRALQLRNLQARITPPVHKEMLVLAWNSEKLVRTVVKERL